MTVVLDQDDIEVISNELATSSVKDFNELSDREVEVMLAALEANLRLMTAFFSQLTKKAPIESVPAIWEVMLHRCDELLQTAPPDPRLNEILEKIRGFKEHAEFLKEIHEKPC